jgi:acyl carrier protein
MFATSDLVLICVIIDVEDKLNIEINDDEYDEITTFKELLHMIYSKINTRK